MMFGRKYFCVAHLWAEFFQWQEHDHTKKPLRSTCRTVILSTWLKWPRHKTGLVFALLIIPRELHVGVTCVYIDILCASLICFFSFASAPPPFFFLHKEIPRTVLKRKGCKIVHVILCNKCIHQSKTPHKELRSAAAAGIILIHITKCKLCIIRRHQCRTTHPSITSPFP